MYIFVLKYFISSYFLVFCPSLSKRKRLLKWTCNRLPRTWSSQSRTLSGGIQELWSDGSLLCTLINTEIPGACPNPHRHWKKPPTHAQALAYKYFGVVPVGTLNWIIKKVQKEVFRNHLLKCFHLNLKSLSMKFQVFNKWNHFCRLIIWNNYQCMKTPISQKLKTKKIQQRMGLELATSRLLGGRSISLIWRQR